MPEGKSRYNQLIEAVFKMRFEEGATEVDFEREDLVRAAADLGMVLPKNLGDVVYSLRYRTEMPRGVAAAAPPGREWIIRPAGRGRYKFVLVRASRIVPSDMLVETKIPDSTPGLIRRYALNDEQALLAILRYNRLIDVFTGLTCYSLQNHLRTTAAGMGQVETDEIYIGLDRRGAHYVIPVQAKGGRDSVGIVQVEQDIAVCRDKFASLACRPVAAQFMADDLIALFEIEATREGIGVVSEKHYRLVKPDDLSTEELEAYYGRAY